MCTCFRRARIEIVGKSVVLALELFSATEACGELPCFRLLSVSDEGERYASSSLFDPRDYQVSTVVRWPTGSRALSCFGSVFCAVGRLVHRVARRAATGRVGGRTGGRTGEYREGFHGRLLLAGAVASPRVFGVSSARPPLALIAVEPLEVAPPID